MTAADDLERRRAISAAEAELRHRRAQHRAAVARVDDCAFGADWHDARRARRDLQTARDRLDDIRRHLDRLYADLEQTPPAQ